MSINPAILISRLVKNTDAITFKDVRAKIFQGIDFFRIFAAVR